MEKKLYKSIVIGAGPAGLTAAYQLSKQGQPVVVLEADPEYVGGISRTVNYKGFHFDIGGHRFFSKSREVEDLWTEIAGDLMLDRPRSSRIYYRGQFFTYPLKPFEALSKLGLIESTLCVLSFIAARLNPTRDPKTFQDLHREGVGDELQRDLRGLGRAANQRTVARLGNQTRAFLQAQTKRPQARCQNADRHLPLSAAGTRNDVGSVRGKNP